MVKRVATLTKAVQELVATFFYETKCEGDDSRFVQHDSILTWLRCEYEQSDGIREENITKLTG